jgi:hypothetical protein
MLLQKRKKHKKVLLGQTLVEYVVTIVIVVAIFNVINLQIQKGIIKLWETLAKEVASACPKGCDPPSSFSN